MTQIVDNNPEIMVDIDDEASLRPVEEINDEIHRIDGMLKKVKGRIGRYQKQISIESGMSEGTLDLVKKGLELLELNKQRDYES